jgi:type IV secretion system protein VirB8
MIDNKSIDYSIKEYIQSGEYFVDARKWYNFKYVSPVAQRSQIFMICCIFLIGFVSLPYSLYSIFPLSKQVRYSIKSNEIYQTGANIIPANSFPHSPLQSIADIMVKNYVVQRESYNYDELKKQFIFLQNHSTRVVFRQFVNFMNIDNRDSPIMRYQKTIKRSVNISSVDYDGEGGCAVIFNSIAKNDNGDIVENILWQAVLNFQIDEINLNLPHDSRFNFTITNYRLKLLKNQLEK